MSQYDRIPCPFKHFVEECTYENIIQGFEVACPFYVVERGVCAYIEHCQGEKTPTKLPTRPVEPPRPVGKRGGPNTEGIQWKFGKGDSVTEARPDDKRAWAFTFKYNAEARQSTDIVRDENVELVEYLDAHNGVYEDGKYRYSIGVNRNFLNRELL